MVSIPLFLAPPPSLSLSLPPSFPSPLPPPLLSLCHVISLILLLRGREHATFRRVPPNHIAQSLAKITRRRYVQRVPLSNSKHGYDMPPSTTAIIDYAIGLEKLSANKQFFTGAQMAVKGQVQG